MRGYANFEICFSNVRECIIHVPTKKVGYLIGKAGRTIFAFERHTGAKIDILAPNSKSPETPVSLKGSHKAVGHVIRSRQDLLIFISFVSSHVLLWD